MWLFKQVGSWYLIVPVGSGLPHSRDEQRVLRV